MLAPYVHRFVRNHLVGARRFPAFFAKEAIEFIPQGLGEVSLNRFRGECGFVHDCSLAGLVVLDRGAKTRVLLVLLMPVLLLLVGAVFRFPSRICFRFERPPLAGD